MKMSDLLQDKETIDSWDIQADVDALTKKLTSIRYNIDGFTDSELVERIISIEDVLRDLDVDLNELTYQVQSVQEQAAELINDKAHDPIVESVDIYDANKNIYSARDTIDKIRKQDLFIDADNRELFNTEIRRHATWKYPSVYVRPNSLKFLNALKASDVLYVMEQCNVVDYMFRKLSSGEFNTLHFKLIDENKDQFMTNTLPINQIGLIVMDNFMNYKPLHIMKRYLGEMFEVLRPGGCAVFTYNDCDYASGAINFENGTQSFTPGKLVRELCLLSGFEIDNDITNNRVSWLSLRKPGELSTLKGGKTLGQIITK